MLLRRMSRCFNSIGMLIFVISLVPVRSAAQEPGELPGFQVSPFFDEQVVTFRLNEDMTLHINAPAIDSFRTDLPVGLALYALPNGNTIEQTVGKVLETGDDWHFDIQHIGAQTRFLRQHLTDYNLVTVYLEADPLSWPTWKTQFPDYDDIIRTTVEYLLGCFADYDPFIVLTGHSGGGRFIFSYLDGVTDIPEYVKRICFLDSNYGYTNSYGDQFMDWLNASSDRYLSVIAYNDSVALYNGEPIVSPTGGTWYRSRMMKQYMDDFYTFTTEEDDDFIRYTALDGRIKIILKKNPDQAILHTVQVERNGFIHTMVTGTEDEGVDYEYYGERAYDGLIQAGILPRSDYQIPLRSANAPTGSAFMSSVASLSFSQRENAILQELYTGNVPYFLRELVTLEGEFEDISGNAFTISYEVMPDYLCIGVDSNYCRVPMGPITAQRAADFFGMCMPTRKLVNHIYTHADIHLAPVTYVPVGNQNETVAKFVEHNTAIEAQLVTAGATLGQLIGGTKKDVVLSNLIIDPSRPGHVTIYGWHQLNGVPIQPLTNIHVDTYVDYSHGIRFMKKEVLIAGNPAQAEVILQDPTYYTLLSDESGRMVQPTYIPDGSLPQKPTSFGAVSENPGEISIFIQQEDNVQQHQLYLGTDGITFGNPIEVNSAIHVMDGLPDSSIIYFRLVAENTSGGSPDSEVLAVLPSGSNPEKVLVVNGFDRASGGNTYNFIRQHGAALINTGFSFESATNDAVLDGLIDLSDYLVVVYILGEESTVDETFSGAEQALVKPYLQQGGRLFVSGAEIAWDLDYRGSSSDKAFFHDYLKATYSADAPGGVSGVHYTAAGMDGSILGDVGTIHYDNGTHGTFDVEWPDALIATNGSQEIARYLNVSSHDLAGISYEGLFPNGTTPGKLVYLGFPFETVYPEDTRNVLMGAVMDFLVVEPSSVEGSSATIPADFVLTPNFPNPFNPSTTLRFGMPETASVELTVYDIRGKRIRTLATGERPAGWHDVVWNGRDDSGNPVAAGMYVASLKGKATRQSIKMLVLK